MSFTEENIVAGDLVMASLETFPTWPAIICYRDDIKPEEGNSCMKVANKKLKLAFVVFIEENPTSAYVQLRNLEKFESTKRSEYLDRTGHYFSLYPGWYRSVIAALEDFFPLSRQERLDLIRRRIAATGEKTDDSNNVDATSNSPKFINSEDGVRLGVYCRCKVVIAMNSRRSDRGRMIGCCHCRNFYHFACVKLMKTPRNPQAYVCPDCAEDCSEITEPADVKLHPVVVIKRAALSEIKEKTTEKKKPKLTSTTVN